MRYSHTKKNFLNPKKQWYKDTRVFGKTYLLLTTIPEKARGAEKDSSWVATMTLSSPPGDWYLYRKLLRSNKRWEEEQMSQVQVWLSNLFYILHFNWKENTKHKHILIVNWYFSFQCQCTACAQNWGLLEALPNGVSQTPGLSPTAKVKVFMTSLLLFQRVESYALCHEGRFSKWF